MTSAQLADVSTALVQLYRRFYGRGPTRAKTISDANVVITVLADILTTVEQTLVERGREDLVTGIRPAFQEAMRHEFIALVETHTGREVEAFTSGVDVEHAIATETFVLVPVPEEPAEPLWCIRPRAGRRARSRRGTTARPPAVRAAALAPCSPAHDAATTPPRRCLPAAPGVAARGMSNPGGFL